MKLRSILAYLPLLMRLLQEFNDLIQPGSKQKSSARRPDTTPSRVKTQAKPAVAASPAPARRARRANRSRSNPYLSTTLRMLFSAAVAGTTAYLVIRQQQRRAARRRPLHAPFPEELLDVLAPPGGNGNFFYSGDGLIDPSTDAFYPVIDGIPDFIGSRAHDSADWGVEVYDPLVHGVVIPLVWQGNRAGAATLAGAIAAEAYDGWCLSVPCGTGVFEIEMARANPLAHIVCVDRSWEMLLEARRKALEAGLANLYFVRGEAELLPLRTGVFDSAWSAHGFPVYARPERAITQLVRVVKAAGLVAGVALVPGGPALPNTALRLIEGSMPGLRDIHTFLSLLAVAGLRELRAVRDGAMVRFLGTRSP